MDFRQTDCDSFRSRNAVTGFGSARILCLYGVCERTRMLTITYRGADLWCRLRKSIINTFLTSETIKVLALTDYGKSNYPNCGIIQDRVPTEIELIFVETAKSI